MSVRVGDLDELECFLGQRKTGKTAHACLRILEGLHRHGGGYVLGHSLGARLPRQMPKELGGNELPISYHATIEKLARALRRHPERWHVLAPPLPHEWGEQATGGREPETADDLLRYAVRLSAVLRLAAYRRKHPIKGYTTRDPSRLDFTGLEVPPVYVLIDEGIAVEGAAASKSKETSRQFLQFIFSIRHMNIALEWCIQDPNARSYQLMSQATLVHVHHTKHQWAVNAIQAAGASDDEIERIEQLHGFEYVTIEVSATQRKHVDELTDEEKKDLGADVRKSDAPSSSGGAKETEPPPTPPKT